MTEQQVALIRQLRKRGLSLQETADALQMKVGTLKSFLHRHPELTIQNDANEYNRCRQCGALLTHTPGSRKKKYCFNDCRYSWWSHHRDESLSPNSMPIACNHCGRLFISHTGKPQKFCSHACYIAHRFGA